MNMAILPYYFTLNNCCSWYGILKWVIHSRLLNNTLSTTSSDERKTELNILALAWTNGGSTWNDVPFVKIQAKVQTTLPVNGMIEVGTDGASIHAGDEKQVNPHAKVCKRQVAHEELWHSHAEAGAEQY